MVQFIICSKTKRRLAFRELESKVLCVVLLYEVDCTTTLLCFEDTIVRISNSDTLM